MDTCYLKGFMGETLSFQLAYSCEGDELGGGNGRFRIRIISDINYLVTEPGEHELPEQELIHTEWFHADCLADYYKVEVFGEEHWRIISEYMRAAVKSGINMILTPIFTPPLDTAPGGREPWCSWLMFGSGSIKIYK